MPREQINTPARRTITPIRDANGKPDGWAQGWYDPMFPKGEGTAIEPTAVLAIGWTHGVVGEETPDGSCMNLVMQISADEVLRKADMIRSNRLLDVKAAELPAGVQAAIVEYPPEVVTFESIALTRPEVQKLIRVTRRARDQVFGGDE